MGEGTQRVHLRPRHQGLFGRTALRTESLPAPAWLDEAPIEDGADRRILWQARVEAVICGSLA